jgi:hypothetical protein
MSESPHTSPAASLSSPYAPLTPDGPLPPALTEAIVSSAYRAFRPDLRAKQVLATLGIRPGLEQASRALRRAVDRPEVRAAEEGAPEATARPPLFLALYVLLRDHLASADFVYNQIVKPAEREREERTFLDPGAFAERVTQSAERFESTAEPVPTGSEAEGLALFALAYGLLQPEDAPAIVGAVAKLGTPFAQFFGLKV